MAGERFLRTADELLRAGGPEVALHLRGRGLPGRVLWVAAEACAAAARLSGSALFVNDRVDVALGCGARGVQLGREAMPIAVARRLLGPDQLIGASVHGAEQARLAEAEGADFVLAGTLYSSASHPGRPGRGPESLAEMASLAVPVIGIGGITPARVEAVRAAGAYGVAVITGIWEAASPVRALEHYLAELERV